LEGEFEDTKGVIRIHISKKNRQHNGQKKKYKQRSTKLTYKTKDRVTRTPLKTGVELRCSGRVSSSCSTSGTRRVNLVTNPVSYVSHYQRSNKKPNCKTGPFIITSSPFHISSRYRFTTSTKDIVFKASELTLLYESIFHNSKV
jgi:hypothetical protein